MVLYRKAPIDFSTFPDSDGEPVAENRRNFSQGEPIPIPEEDYEGRLAAEERARREAAARLAEHQALLAEQQARAAAEERTRREEATRLAAEDRAQQEAAARAAAEERAQREATPRQEAESALAAALAELARLRGEAHPSGGEPPASSDP